MSRAYGDPPWWRALRLEDAIALGAITTLPWLFGGVEQWAFRAAAAVLTLALAVGACRRGGEATIRGASARWLLPAWLLAALAVVQVVPLPSVAVRLLSPRAAALQDATFPPSSAERTTLAWVEYLEDQALARVPEGAAVALVPGDDGRSVLSASEGGPRPPGRWRTISLHRAATIEMTFWYLALFATFVLVSSRVQERETAVAYRQVLFGLFAVLAAVGLFDAFAGNGKILWIREPLTGGRHFGPYINATHFAGVMELATPWLIGHGWLALRREGVGAFRRGGKAPATLACGALCLAAGLTAASKMAAVLMAASLVVLAWYGLTSTRRRLLLLAAIVLFAVPSVLLVRGTTLGARFTDFLSASGGDIGGNERIVAWTAGLAMLADFPALGCGFGAFPQVFPAYVPAGEAGYWLRIHNDWLELALEGGLAALALTVWLAVAWVGRAVRARRRSVGEGKIGLSRLGLWLGLTSLAVHAAVDFNHQIPANALLFVTAAAVALAPELTVRSGGDR